MVSSLQCLSWNVRSMNNKVSEVMSFISDQSASFFFVSETWIDAQTNNTTHNIKSFGYNIVHTPRSCIDKTCGGGVGIIYKKCFNLIKCNVEKYDTFEHISATFKCADGTKICCSSIYRPGVLCDAFFEEFDVFVGDLFTKFSKLIICGDFNIHLDNANHLHTRRFNEILSSYGLEQLVQESTHKDGHWLDLIISSPKLIDKKSLNILGPVTLSNNCKPDHYPCLFTLNNSILVEKSKPKTINFRNIQQVDNMNFKHDLASNLADISFSNDFESAIISFNKLSANILESHAPLLTKKIKDRPSAPWFDGEYKSLRSERRKAEKKKFRSAADYLTYTTLSRKCTELADLKKEMYFRTQFEKHNYSAKSLFSFVNNFLDQDNVTQFPSLEALPTIVENFNSFFEQKIQKIRESFPTDSSQNEKFENFFGEELAQFREATYEEIETILNSADFKTSAIDPLPASLMKDNLDILIPVFCNLVNLSLRTGSIDGAKVANITPLLKSLHLDPSDLKNYRPISNLTFIGKLIERVVLMQLNEHLEANNLQIPLQSGYKKSYSTETLLVRIVNDLLIASEEGKATIVMMLDLSAAFDTVDHSKLLRILRHELGIRGIALKWFESFLTGRCQKVSIDGCFSAEIIIKFGVPQGSVLGPVLFNLYIRSLYRTIKNLKFCVHGYADDHQVYKSFTKLEEYIIHNHDIPNCFHKINDWMSQHYLLLNPGKTELIVFGSPSMLSSLSIKGVFLNNGVCVRFSPVAKNLGILLDNSLTFCSQVKKLKTSLFLKLRNIAKMKRFLNTDQLIILTHAIILSSIDYCNSLYIGCSKSTINQLQLIQNRACRIIFGLKKRDSVQEKLKDLHWLKVEERIKFKVLLLVYKSIRNLSPSYLSELLCSNDISDKRSVSLKCNTSVKHSSRAFQFVGIKLWNELPDSLRNIDDIGLFKKHLKTHLFKLSF